MSTPEQQYASLVKGQNLSTDDVLAAFDKLKPVKPEQFVGSWKGANVNTNHPTEGKLTGMGWAGKDFRSTEDVDPIMVTDESGKRVWNESWGHARLRQIEWRGVLSTAMVYDDFPIIDYFRYVNDDLLAGAMDAKTSDAGTYYFYLYRE
ncbi:hypothetical protein N7448_010070 [Penicillium atrosanguineum]|uniref:DUF4334 domain-containing protein n=1 Tax=Penicillium atrosanguineum TaxID=1132637 RepID=A0A9W9TZU6_9EURO|nr:hypothetical protein N7448_010070 [Penicillium atrosanguineum]KAJ5299164.1 hypothetical protein N7476_010721 [Penicillium atrosanguineum]